MIINICLNYTYYMYFKLSFSDLTIRLSLWIIGLISDDQKNKKLVFQQLIKEESIFSFVSRQTKSENQEIKQESITTILYMLHQADLQLISTLCQYFNLHQHVIDCLDQDVAQDIRIKMIEVIKFVLVNQQLHNISLFNINQTQQLQKKLNSMFYSQNNEYLSQLIEQTLEISTKSN